MDLNESVTEYKLVNKKLTVICKLPPKVEILKTKYGEYGLFAKDDIQQNEIIWSNKEYVLNGEDFDNEANLITDFGEYNINKYTHFSGADKENKTFFIYSFGCFTNHSCDPNTTDDYLSKDEKKFKVFSRRKIKKGEEI